MNLCLTTNVTIMSHIFYSNRLFHLIIESSFFHVKPNFEKNILFNLWKALFHWKIESIFFFFI